MTMLVANAGPVHAQSAGTLVRQMLLSVKSRHWAQGEAVIALTHDRFAIKLYNWLYYTENGGPVAFGPIAAFIDANPDWPRQGKLKLAAEKAMPDNLPDADVVAWFGGHAPLTPQGMDRYLQALINTGRDPDAEKNLRAWWRTASLTPDQQAYFIRAYSPFLDHDSQLVRMDTVLGRGDYRSAQMIADSLGGGYPALAVARIALLQGRSNADDYLRGVPAPLRQDPPLLLDRVRYDMRQNDVYGALEIMHNAPSPDRIDNVEGWWQARSALTRLLMKSKQYESAYLLVSHHGLTDGASFADAEFMSGWLALRFMHKPEEAFRHFDALYKGSSTPVTRARGAYWAGQASAAGGNVDVARQWYQAAAKHQTTFYGQLAIGELKPDQRPPQQTPPPRTMADQEEFGHNEMVRAAQFLNNAGMTDETTDFLDAIATAAKTPEQFRLAAELAENMGHPQNAVRIAKKGLNRNIMLIDQLFPTILSHMKRVTIEWALCHALIRQESTFDTHAQSPVGALGLMQLMPATAAEVARKNGLPYRPDLLLNDPDYNIELGSLYFKQLLVRYDNSYPLAVAAYNAGPGRVNGWLNDLGDPRHDQVALADWIELIPIAETRNYVQRVLEGVYIYRLKLHGVQKSYQPD